MKARLTPTRARRSTRAGFSRREFLEGPARSSSASRRALRSTAPARRWRRDSTAPAARSSMPGSRSRPDGRVTAYTGKCELGQGLYTAQMQLVAEELCVPFDRVRLDSVRHVASRPIRGRRPGQQSHPTNFNTREPGARGGDGARGAAAAGRDAPRRRRLTQLVASDGVISARGDRVEHV